MLSVCVIGHNIILNVLNMACAHRQVYVIIQFHVPVDTTGHVCWLNSAGNLL